MTLTETMDWIELEANQPMDPVTRIRHPISGYAELQVFPSDFLQSVSDGRPAPTMARIPRPYQEVIDLLRFNNELLNVDGLRTENRRQWDHVNFPVTYINTLESTFAINQLLWHCYIVSADLELPFLILTPPPSYPPNSPTVQ